MKKSILFGMAVILLGSAIGTTSVSAQTLKEKQIDEYKKIQKDFSIKSENSITYDGESYSINQNRFKDGFNNFNEVATYNAHDKSFDNVLSTHILVGADNKLNKIQHISYGDSITIKDKDTTRKYKVVNKLTLYFDTPSDIEESVITGTSGYDLTLQTQTEDYKEIIIFFEEIK